MADHTGPDAGRDASQQTPDSRFLQMSDDEIAMRMAEIEAEQSGLDWYDDAERLAELTNEYNALNTLSLNRLKEELGRLKQSLRQEAESRRLKIQVIAVICAAALLLELLFLPALFRAP